MEKRKEYDAVMALDKVSAELVERLEALGEDCEIMADAGQGISDDGFPSLLSPYNEAVQGSVLEHWSKMFGIINLVGMCT